MHTDAATPALEWRHLRLVRSGNILVDDCSLALLPRERLALIGPNGAGKSSLLHLLSGGQRPDTGHIYLHGQRIDGKTPAHIQRLGLSRSFQISQLFGKLSVQDNLRCAALSSSKPGWRLFTRLHRIAPVCQRADELMEQLQLTDQRHTLAQHLAYAQQRILELGIALASRPSVLLLDEPSAGLSLSETEIFKQRLLELTQGCTVLLVEHDMQVVFYLAQRIAVLVQGQIIATGSPEEIRTHSQVQHLYQFPSRRE